jgi:TatD DNase family protein
LESFTRDGSLDAVLARARAAGLGAMITIGTSPDDWAAYRDISQRNGGFIHFTIGLHPCAVDGGWEVAVGQIESYWSHQSDAAARGIQPVALGECGLDRFHLPKIASEADKVFAWQRAAFARQLEIAKRLGCPLVVHSRGAFQECVEMIDVSGVDWKRVVFHCFTEGVAEMQELQRRGGFGSFTGILTYKNADNIRAAAKTQGLARMMIETDAPYLTPMPHRGKPNEPAFLRHTAEFAAREVFNISSEEFAAITTANAKRFFWGV